MVKLRRQQGITLIELMIVVVIVGVLAAIAIPSYQSHMVKSNRAAVQSFMLAAASKQEQYLLDNRAYATAANLDTVITTLKINEPNSKVRQFYEVAITRNPANGTNPRTFLITATPVAGSRQVADGILELDHTGRKTPANKW